MNCVKTSYQSEGWRIFFRGLTPTIIRAFPSNAATFAAYTWAMKLCQRKDMRSTLNQNDITLLEMS